MRTPQPQQSRPELLDSLAVAADEFSEGWYLQGDVMEEDAHQSALRLFDAADAYVAYTSRMGVPSNG